MTKISNSIKYKVNWHTKEADYIIVNGERIRIANFNPPNKKNDNFPGLDAPYGYKRNIMTPWGFKEDCIITPMPNMNGSLDFYATCDRPKHNIGVRNSTFLVDNSLL
jgi:hypothetical protein